MNNRQLRFKNTSGQEINVLVNHLVMFVPNGEGSTLTVTTGDHINVAESNRTVRSQLKKFDKAATEAEQSAED
jgi:hypothetical protein